MIPAALLRQSHRLRSSLRLQANQLLPAVAD